MLVVKELVELEDVAVGTSCEQLSRCSRCGGPSEHLKQIWTFTFVVSNINLWVCLRIGD